MKKALVFFLLSLVPLTFFAKELSEREIFYFFYSSSCPHCHEAIPFIEELEKERPDITFKKLEVSGNEANRTLFRKKSEKLGINGSGVPTFMFRDKYLVGFRKGLFEKKIRAMIKKPVKKPVKK